MNILVTAGNTQTPIDRVRCLTNIFTGKTGGRIAVEAARRGHSVTQVTSHPEILAELATGVMLPPERWRIKSYRTFDDLARLLEEIVPNGGFDAIVHAAAVSDYALGGIFAAAPDAAHGGTLNDVSAGKVKSHYPELWLRLVPTPKLVDRIRQPWGFGGTLVKFKLEVGLGDDELVAIAERSRLQSQADLIVANTLEGMKDFAYLGPLHGRYERIERAELAQRVIDAIEVIGRR